MQINNLDPPKFRAMFKTTASDVLLIDVRTPEEFTNYSLPNAININYLGDEFWDQIEALNPENTYLVYCRTGRRSLRACTLMKNGGFNKEKIFNLDGGIVAWETEFGPLLPKD